MALSEKRPGGPEPKDFARQFLFNPTTLGKLLDEKTRSHEIERVKSIFKFTTVQTTNLADYLIQGLGNNDDEDMWNTDRKKGATLLLTAIQFDKKAEPERLTASIVSALNKQDEFTNPLGSPLFLANAYTILKPHLSKSYDAQTALVRAWLRWEMMYRGRRGWDEIERLLHPVNTNKKKEVVVKQEKKTKRHGGGRPAKDVSHITDADMGVLQPKDREFLRYYRDWKGPGKVAGVSNGLGIPQSTVARRVRQLEEVIKKSKTLA